MVDLGRSDLFIRAILLEPSYFGEVCLGLFEVVLEDLDRLGRLAYFHEGPDINEVFVKLHHVVRPVHVNKYFLFLELHVFVLGGVVAEGRL